VSVVRRGPNLYRASKNDDVDMTSLRKENGNISYIRTVYINYFFKTFAHIFFNPTPLMYKILSSIF
jgi:hypothetical protein